MTSANIYTENFEMSFLISAVAKAEVNYTGLKIYLKQLFFNQEVSSISDDI